MIQTFPLSAALPRTLSSTAPLTLGRYRIAALSRELPCGRFAAQVTLPVCITGAMDWQVTVLIENGGERIAIPYRFSSGGHE